MNKRPDEDSQTVAPSLHSVPSSHLHGVAIIN